MEFQEFTGDNVDLAINEACTRLQVPSFELEYEVINKESAGFLGFGKKPARIRARKKEVQEKVKAEPMQKQEPKKKEEKPVKKVEASAPVVEEKKEESKQEVVDIQKELEAKFDELFGSLNDVD